MNPPDEHHNLFHSPSDASSTASSAAGVITELSPLPSDPNVIRVKVDQRIVARLTAGAVDELKLTVGQVYEDVAADIEQRQLMDRARKLALQLLGKRAYSRSEILERLQRRDVDPAIAESVVHELESHGWIDDQQFAAALVDQMTAEKPAGSPLLMKKLLSRGIPESIAESAIADALGERDSVVDAMALAQKRLKSLAKYDQSTQARRIAGLLGRRGFDEETVREVLVQLELIDPSTG